MKDVDLRGCSPRNRVVFLSVALHFAVLNEKWDEAKHIKRELDEQFRLAKQEKEAQ